MEDLDWLAPTLTALGFLITAIGSVYAAVKASAAKDEAATAKEEAAAAKEQSVKTAVAVDGKMEAVVKLVEQKVTAEATLAEKEAQFLRTAEARIAGNSPEEILARARADAAKLLEDARAAAAKILADSNAKPLTVSTHTNGLLPKAPTPVEVVQGAGISEPLKVDQHKDAPK